MPLQQFLAFYQVIEFYFPTYLGLKIRDSILEIVKKPDFDPDNPTDREKLLKDIKPFISRDKMNEQSQLKYTIESCLESQNLLNFIEIDEGIREALTNNGNILSKHKLELDDKNIDIRELVAKRLYDIRCKVVHTKGDENPILPFTKEAEALNYDVELIQYIAQQVLIANSKLLQV